jgi:SagB-type dehydrogenase family enzyme
MKHRETSIGFRFQQETKYARSLRPSADPSGPAPQNAGSVSLKRPPAEKGPGLWETLARRRSVREYREEAISLDHLAGLIWASQGLTGRMGSSYRTAPSAGALHPIDTYVIVNRVEGLERGIYFLDVPRYALTMRRSGDFSPRISGAALDQEAVRDAAVVFAWVAVVGRSRRKYRERAYRYIYLDCGHICQNVYLAASALDLGCCGIGAFFDDEVNFLLGVDGEGETAIYLATVGKKANGGI